MPSPYELIHRANELIPTMILEFKKSKEEKVLKLINSAETYPNMSSYQIMKARIIMIDLYISHKIYGSAYELCRIVLANNPEAPVRRKMKKLEEIKERYPEQWIFSSDQNIVDFDLVYGDQPAKVLHDKNNQLSNDLDPLGKKLIPENRRELKEQIEQQIMAEADDSDRIYDPEWEKEIEERLSRLDERSRSEFYRLRTTRKRKGLLSIQEMEELTLEAMEKSFAYRNAE